MTWFGLWPLLILPAVMMIALGALVTPGLGGHGAGGNAVQYWCIVHLLLDWLPHAAQARLAAVLARADAPHRWMLYLLVTANVNALMLPPLYALGSGLLRLQAWSVRRDLELKTRAARTGR